jgi:DNA-binding GntR family transcriptional regulator
LSEAGLADQFGISRTPVSEAIRQLQSEGLVEQTATGRTQVRVLDEAEIRELLALRVLLEGYAAAEAALHARAIDVRELRSAQAQLATVAERLPRDREDPEFDAASRQFALADAAFHVTLLRISGRRRTGKMVSDLQILVHILGHGITPPEGESLDDFLTRVLGEHDALVDAIDARDPQAAIAVLTTHMLGPRHSTETIATQSLYAQAVPESDAATIRLLLEQLNWNGE